MPTEWEESLPALPQTELYLDYIKNCKIYGVGEVALQLRTLAALVEDPSSVQPSVTQVPWDPALSSGLCGYCIGTQYMAVHYIYI